MRYKKRRKFYNEKKLFSSFLAILILIITFYLIFSNIKLSQKRKELDMRAEELRGEVIPLREKNEQLQGGLLNILQMEYKERILREKGLYKKEGESVVVILSPEEEIKEEERNIEEPKGFFEKILDKINWRD
jgi:cell division protein FtsB